MNNAGPPPTFFLSCFPSWTNGAGIVTPVAGDHDDFTVGGQQDTQSGTAVIDTLDDKNSSILVLVLLLLLLH
jgi:hypothetical protein